MLLGTRPRRGRPACEGFEAVADGGVEHLVADADDDAAEDVGLDAEDSSTLRPVCSAIRSPMLRDGLLVELDRGGDLDRAAACCAPPTARRSSRRMRKIAGMRWFSISSSRKLRKIGLGVRDRALQAVLLLLRREVGREEEDLQLAVLVERVGELRRAARAPRRACPGPRRPRTASGRRRRRSPPWPSAPRSPESAAKSSSASGLLDEPALVVVGQRLARDLLRGEHGEVGDLGADLLDRAARLGLDVARGSARSAPRGGALRLRDDVGLLLLAGLARAGDDLVGLLARLGRAARGTRRAARRPPCACARRRRSTPRSPSGAGRAPRRCAGTRTCRG